jgi:hypothetical protein
MDKTAVLNYLLQQYIIERMGYKTVQIGNVFYVGRNVTCEEEIIWT